MVTSLSRIRRLPDHVGLETDGGVIDVTSADPRVTWTEVLASWPETRALIEVVAATTPGDPDLQVALPVLGRAKLIGIGLNYRRHAEEAGATIPSAPVVFAKLPNTLTLSGAPVALPVAGHQYDYEVELGVVIGRPVTAPVREARALRHVFGYLTANDLSARDIQQLSSQWTLGKSLDGFLPVAPRITPADVVADPQGLPLHAWVNGELRQSSNTADMIFGVAEIISFLSRYMTLDAGDLILTGTPEGVVLGMPEPKPWLAPGDVVDVEVEGLGRVSTPLVAPVADGGPM